MTKKVLIPKGYCDCCGSPRVKIKNNLWLCPFIIGSPMHFGYKATNKRFECYGITLEEYEIAVKEYWVLHSKKEYRKQGTQYPLQKCGRCWCG